MGWSTSPEDRLRELEFSSCRREDSRETLGDFPVPKGAYRKAVEVPFTMACSDRKEEMALKRAGVA